VASSTGRHRPSARQGTKGDPRRRARRQSDEVTSLEIVGLMEKLWKQRGMTLVLVTHDTKLARRAPCTAVITKGKLTMRDNRAPNVTGAARPWRPGRASDPAALSHHRPDTAGQGWPGTTLDQRGQSPFRPLATILGWSSLSALVGAESLAILTASAA